jgi:molecular chaperone DnaK
VGIPPAPRGVPQIEVTFDIDANGLLNVSAKDLGTGKEQSIRITPSSGLSEEEVDRMVKEAEANAEADKKKKELVELRNQADTLVYSTEKSLKEHGDKVDAETKENIEKALDELKKVQAGEDTEAIKKAIENLSNVSHKLAEAVYQATGGQQSGSAEAETGSAENAQTGGSDTEEDVVDADYEEVNEENKDK